MHDATLKRVIEILESDPDFYVPIKKLWLMLQQEGLEVAAEVKDFSNYLRTDARFDFASGIDLGGRSLPPELCTQEEQQLEALGIFGGPRVKLVAREMTVEDIFIGLSNSLKSMNDALQSAWDTRPDGDQETEDQLLEILAAGQKLEQEIQDLLSKDDSKTA